MAKDDTLFLRSELTVLVNRVPASINSASIQTVRSYKDAVVKARKLIESRKANASTLTGMIRELRQF